ncbi:hypothetical protein [Actinomadura sp. 9N407]|uniref:hypothetical protein n=1 Tax=Actinomadura sp. 9N407 TaxID=3375154 RepID=UPI0037B03CCF
MIANLRGVARTTSRPVHDEPPEPAARGRADPARLVPAVLVLGWSAVLLAHLRTPVPSDQVNYLTAAARFPDPVEATTEMHQMTRFGLIVPARLAMAVFGHSQAAYGVVPVLATLALLLGTYALGTLLFARSVGAAGGLTVVAATPVFADSTDLLPDVLAVGLFTCALAIAVAVRQRDDPPGRLVLLSIGALLGWSYLTREFIVFVWPVIPVLLYRRAGLAGLLWTAAPIVAAGLAELLLCWRLYGDPLARLLSVTGHGQRPSSPEIASTYRDKPRMLYVLRFPKTLRTYPEGAFLVAMLGLTLLGGLLRPRRMAVLVATCVLLWVPLTLFGGVLDPSAPKLRLQLIRYWYPIFPALVLGGLGLLWLLARDVPVKERVRAVLPAVLVLTVAATVTGTAARSWWGAPGTRIGGGTQLEALRSWMHDRDGTYPRIWTDPRTRKILPIYRQGFWGGPAWSAEIQAVRPGQPAAPRAGDLVLFYDTERGHTCSLCKRSARTVWGDIVRPRPGWREVFATRDRVVRLYEVGAEGRAP